MMRLLWIGGSALLSSFAAQAEAASTTYAKVGGWEISAEPPRCIMQGFFGGKDGKKVDGLTILYAADKGGVLLIWSNNWMTYLPTKGELDLGLVFGKDGTSVDASWGSSKLRYEKVGNDYMFTRAFKDPQEAEKFLRDFGGSQVMGLTLGGTLLTSVKPNASEAIMKLRECSLSGSSAE
ncbi:hypothetical protein [Sphingomonas arenae]|uniref:hypothetical protein n=1 Tax=Sphingomonas arenae TaxID=2812555 RepID=UPI0019684E2B|nr:hypothetical protein [Sphingomonas arenae]